MNKINRPLLGIMPLLLVSLLVACQTQNIEDSISSSIITEESSETETSSEITIDGDDPYLDVNAEKFYENYKPASNWADAYFRSKHYLMSGDITVPAEAPTVAAKRPKKDGKLIKNSRVEFTDDGNTYNVYDSSNNIKKQIYKDGAYITLEDVAAYVYAFGTKPCNYSSKSARPKASPWGIYLRANYTNFIGNTKRYPYQPALPEISGINNGRLLYKEMDIGTTGTTCNPSYPSKPYNDGVTIVRGAARLVFSEFDNETNKPITDFKDRYVFYTYNHYNDFQEYLNYHNGWGYMFGNITGGGKLSSKSDYNPTSYIETIRANLI